MNTQSFSCPKCGQTVVIALRHGLAEAGCASCGDSFAVVNQEGAKKLTDFEKKRMLKAENALDRSGVGWRGQKIIVEGINYEVLQRRTPEEIEQDGGQGQTLARKMREQGYIAQIQALRHGDHRVYIILERVGSKYKLVGII